MTILRPQSVVEADDPALLGRAAAGIVASERSDLGSVLVAAGDGPAATVAARLLEMTVPDPGNAATGRDGAIICFAERRWLVVCEADAEERIADRIRAQAGDAALLAVPYGDQLPWFDLAGDRVEPTLRQGGFLHLGHRDFPVGMVRRVALAQIPIVVWRWEPDRWRLGIERSRARAFVVWLAAAAGEG